MNDLDPVLRSDQQLLADLVAGDPSAIGELAQRFSSDLYDFAIRVVLDAVAAASVVEGVLERAQSEAGAKPPFLSLRAWLIGLARDGALEVLRQRGRDNAEPDAAPTPLSPSDEMFYATQDASISDLALWAWQASRSQRPRDYSLLDLSIRRKLTPEEVAEVSSLSRTGIYSVLGRLRGTFEESFSAAALFFMGRQNCPELDALANNGKELRPAVRRDIAKHAESCQNCRTTLSGMPLASDLFTLILNVELSPELSSRISALYPPPAAQAAGAGAAIAAAGAAGVAGAIGAASLWDDDDEDADAAAEPVDLEAETMLLDRAGLQEPEAFIDPEPYIEPEPEQPPPPAQDVTLRAPRMPAPDPSAMTTARMPRQAPPPPPPVEPASVLDSLYGDEAEEEDNYDLYGDEEPEPEDDSRADRAVPLTFTRGRGRGNERAAAAGATTQDRIRFERQDLQNKPASSGGGFLSGGGRGIWVIALLIGIALVSGYLGWAFGDSIDSNGNSNSVASLPTRPGGGARSLGCGSGPVVVDQGSMVTLSLDSRALNGFQISGVSVAPVSAGATPNAVVARTQGGNNIIFEASVVPGQAGRLDEYRMSLTLVKGAERVISDCTVQVRAPATAPVATQPPAAPTQPPAATTPPAGGPAGSPTRVP